MLVSRYIRSRSDDHSLSAYLSDIKNVPLLRPDEEVDLTIKIRQGDPSALTKLIQANLRFVVSVAHEYRNQGLPLCDLINEGNYGLIKAAYRFDETKGFKFISYAVWWIRQCIFQALAEQSRMIRIPLNKVSTVNKVSKTHNSLEQEFEREPTIQEIASALEISIDEVTTAMQLSGSHVSLDDTLKQGETGSLLEITENETLPPPDQPLTKESLQKEINKALKSLSAKEAEVIRLYFGIDMDRPRSLDEIGQRFKLTRERVRQIKERAISRLRHQSRSRELQQYLGDMLQ